MPYVPIDSSLGLHQIQEFANQLRYMEMHSQRLLKLINVILERTYRMAPLRTGGYALGRGEHDNPHESERERLIEKAIWKKWRWDQIVAPDGPQEHFVRNRCSHIQTFQMPLQNVRADTSWGKIDIVGVSVAGTPIVFELKQENARDTPLRMLVEGLAYATVVRKAWNEGTLREQWLQHVVPAQQAGDIPVTLLTVPVVGIAPSAFWNRQTGPIGTMCRVRDEAWPPFNKLCDACEERGFPISFLEFDIPGDDEHGLPMIENVRPLLLPQ